MIRITLTDGSHTEVPREEALELLPYRHVLVNPNFQAPVEGLIYHRGKVVPVLGPLPESPDAATIEDRPWLLLLKGFAYAIRGLPEFRDEARSNVVPLKTAQEEESALLSELDDILRAA